MWFHEAYIGRLSSQALELKEKALAYERTGEARYASSLITGEMTLHQLREVTLRLLRMKARVRACNGKLGTRYRRMERAVPRFQEDRKHQDISLQVIRGLSLQLMKDEVRLSSLGQIKTEEEEKEAETEAASAS